MNIRLTHGFTLIEVLIAVAILSFGMLGIAAMQVTGIRANQGSYFRSQATFMASDMAERMYSNRPGLRALRYDGLASGGVACGTLPATRCSVMESNGATPANCDEQQMATFDRFIASCGDLDTVTSTQRGGVEDMLPQGELTITCLTVACLANPATAACTSSVCAADDVRRVSVSWSERVKTSVTDATATSRSAGQATEVTQTVSIMVQP